MLSAKPWKPEAVARLLMSVFACIFAGSVVVSVLHYPGAKGGMGPGLFYPLAAAALTALLTALYLVATPWRFETLMRRLFTALLCFYAGIFIGAWVHKGAGAATASVSQMIIAALSFQGAAVVLVVRFVREHQVGWTEAFGFTNQGRHALLLGIIAACLFLPVGWGLQQASALVMTHIPKLHYQPEEQQAVQALRIAASWADRMALALVTILLAPVAEELLFRGILYPWIKQTGFPRAALWGTAVIFAAVHFNLVVFVPLLVLALVLTVLYERTNNLLAPIAAHSLFNGLNFAMLFILEKRLS